MGYRFDFKTGKVTELPDSNSDEAAGPMTKMQDRAMHLVVSHNGLRSTELFSKLSTEFLKLEPEVIGSLVGNLVERGDLIAINFGPTSREFILFVPRGFDVKVLDANEYTRH